MGLLSELAAQAVPTLVALSLFYTIALPIYRVYFSPLSKFPGPKIAAATLWYEFYYDVILSGQYTFKIQELHKQYGPIVRISPFELHINDADYFDVLYSNNLPVNKSSWYTGQFDMSYATFGTIEHKQHRLRRSALNPFFSKQMINRLEPTIQTVVERLSSRLNEFRGIGRPVEMRAAYSALTIDVITAYAFNESWDHLDSPDFKKDWFDGVHLMMGAGNFMKQFPWLFNVVRVLPQFFVVGSVRHSKIYSCMRTGSKLKRKESSLVSPSQAKATVGVGSIRRSCMLFFRVACHPKREQRRGSGAKGCLL